MNAMTNSDYIRDEVDESAMRIIVDNPGNDFLRTCAEVAEQRAADAESAQIRANWQRRYALRERDRWRRRFRVLLAMNFIVWCALAVLAGVYYFPQIRSAQPLHMTTEEVDQ